MLTVIIRRSDEPKVIQMTQENIIRELSQINGAEMLLEDSWTVGLRKVRTPFVCLVEADCVLSGNYISSNVGLMKKGSGLGANAGKGSGAGGGGYTKVAMIASCLGVSTFANRIYDYHLMKTAQSNGLESWHIQPDRKKRGTKLYSAQVGFVPGAIIRYASITDIIDTMAWDTLDLVQLSTRLSFHFWGTNRRVQVNPNTTYVSNQTYLEKPPLFAPEVPDMATNTFNHEMIGLGLL